MDFADQMSQPVKAVHQVWEPYEKHRKKARVKGTFLQANIREMEECAKASHNVLEVDIDQEPLNARTLLILIPALLVAFVGMCPIVR